MATFTKLVKISSSSMHCWVCMDQRANKSVPETDYEEKRNLVFNEQLICETLEKLTITRPGLETVYENYEDTEEETQFPIISNILCPGCKMQRYCCLNHLKIDRNEHRDLCQILTELQEEAMVKHPLLLLGEAIFSILQLQRTIGLLKYITHVKLQRELTPREDDLIGHPAYCQICYKLEDLRTCGGCGAVAYCSEVHGEMDVNKHTPDVCRTLALVYSPYRQIKHENLKLSDIPIEISMAGQLPVSLKESHLIEAVQRFTGLAVNDSPWSTFQDYQNFATCSSFSGIASICMALSQITYTAKPENICTIYVVDPSFEQIQRYFQEMHFKFFFHMYKDICQLDLYFIGDQLKLRRNTQIIDVITFEFQGLKRTIAKHICPMRFKQFSCRYRIDPVLIIMFNADLYGLYTIREQIIEKMSHICLNPQNKKEDWIQCLIEIIGIYRVPICFTSFTKALSLANFMAILELANQCGIEVKRCYRGDMNENPYREILPKRNQNPEIPEAVIYANNYLEVVFTFTKE